MRESTDEASRDIDAVRALLTHLDPAPEAAPTEADRQRGERLLAAVQSSLDHPGIPPVRSSRRRRGRRGSRAHALAVAVGVVAAVTVLLVGFTVLRPGEPATAAPLLPAPLLTVTSGDHDAATRALARAAAQQRTVAPAGTGPVLYTRRQTYGLDVAVARHQATTVARTTIVDMWRRADGSRHIARHLQYVNRVGADVGGPRPADIGSGQTEFPPSPPDLDPAAMPSDASRLRARLAARTPAAADSFGIAGNALSDLSLGLTSPQQNAAYYEVLAQLPTVFDAGPVRDRAGRPGHAIGVVVSDHTSLVVGTEYLILSDTGTPLTIETVDTPDAPPGLRLPPGPTVETYTQLFTTSHVQAVGDTS
ncbi:CU044_5270 family protein [Frankia gtarii]|uniref:CU044_5270 family protein n=1 Tax=Frankia gtarii TaxID=2950102 RepID=UPI0021BF1240|nr:CU044_5270 family protein [Frankia gtarii]